MIFLKNKFKKNCRVAMNKSSLIINLIISCFLISESFSTNHEDFEDRVFLKRKATPIEKIDSSIEKRLRFESSYSKINHYWFVNIRFSELENKLKKFFEINKTQPDYLKSKLKEFENFCLDDQNLFYSNYYSLRCFLIKELTTKTDIRKPLSILGQIIFLRQLYSLEEFEHSINHLASIFNNSLCNNTKNWHYSTVSSNLTLIQAFDHILYYRNFISGKSSIRNIKDKSQCEDHKSLPYFLRKNFVKTVNNVVLVNKNFNKKNDIDYLETLLFNDEELPSGTTNKIIDNVVNSILDQTPDKNFILLIETIEKQIIQKINEFEAI